MQSEAQSQSSSKIVSNRAGVRRPGCAAQVARGRCPLGRPARHHRRRRAGARAVDDQHGHRGRDRHRDPDQGTGASRFGTGAHHGEHAGSGRGRAGRARAARPHGRVGAAGRRFPLQRPFAAARLPRVRGVAVQVPDQSGQRRPRREARHAVRADDRSRGEVRQAGADRRQLGQSRSGPAREDDGRERRARHAVGSAKRDVRSADPVGDRFGANGRSNSAWRATRSFCRARSAACRI